MQFTILSTKLEGNTVEEFLHEFRNVHAGATRAMAKQLGIISKYVQGVPLNYLGKEDIQNLPFSDLECKISSFAQLSWPSIAVLQGALSTEGYRKSAGSHVFATATKIYLTEQLNSDVEDVESADAVRVMIGLSPHLELNFQQAWDDHAAFCREICPTYQRHRSISLEPGRAEQIFDHTLFPPNLVELLGGYEDFVFETPKQAQEFFDKYSHDLSSSYAKFVDSEKSFAYALDNVIQYRPAERGPAEVVTGHIVSCALRLKLFLNL
jgi:alkanesulfonate monooxygenase SsuD/methylene tetrahydromethanopterin reductase-like flavin-dependent oxidoreductase (luciferase family)